MISHTSRPRLGHVSYGQFLYGICKAAAEVSTDDVYKEYFLGNITRNEAKKILESNDPELNSKSDAAKLPTDEVKEEAAVNTDLDTPTKKTKYKLSDITVGPDSALGAAGGSMAGSVLSTASTALGGPALSFLPLVGATLGAGAGYKRSVRDLLKDASSKDKELSEDELMDASTQVAKDRSGIFGGVYGGLSGALTGGLIGSGIQAEMGGGIKDLKDLLPGALVGAGIGGLGCGLLGKYIAEKEAEGELAPTAKGMYRENLSPIEKANLNARRRALVGGMTSGYGTHGALFGTTVGGLAGLIASGNAGVGVLSAIAGGALGGLGGRSVGRTFGRIAVDSDPNYEYEK